MWRFWAFAVIVLVFVGALPVLLLLKSLVRRNTKDTLGSYGMPTLASLYGADENRVGVENTIMEWSVRMAASHPLEFPLTLQHKHLVPVSAVRPPDLGPSAEAELLCDNYIYHSSQTVWQQNGPPPPVNPV